MEPGTRIVIIDVVRGIAIIGVVIFHLVWDLDLTGLIAPGLAGSPAWLLFGRVLAGTFMFLVGISLALAHSRKIHWRAFSKRLSIVAVAALAISIATKFAFPQSFIYFGILHAIVAGSLIGILFLRIPSVLTIICGVAMWTLPYYFGDHLFDSRWLAWIGFAELPPLSNDFVPIFPWVGLVLLGLALARTAISFSLVDGLRAGKLSGRSMGCLAWCGRHSLVIYLIHQPLLLAIILPLARLLD